MDDKTPHSEPDPGPLDDGEWLAQAFESHRGHLRAVAHRMLGSATDADDAVQEAWLRLSRSDPSEVVNLGGWLTTVVARVSLDMLRSRASRREDPWDAELAALSGDDRRPGGTTVADPAAEAELADSVGVALLVVLDTLAPAERLAFVLHDLFGVPFEEIAPIVDRSPAAARQLASRARRRVRASDGDGAARTETSEAEVGSDAPASREVVAAFLAASRGGDLGRLLELLAPDVVVRADAAAVAMGSVPLTEGAEAVAQTFVGRARGARLALLDGSPGALWSVGGTPKVAFAFTVDHGLIVAVDLLADPDRLAALEVAYLRD
ncbi:RNA polymerase sigma 70 [Intrasporangium oryzae NRRL B-24470]|uniref:RNA polymerase sigma 70 n=1 Tax=Intrasporangium oryzae NRRL B-24470 TaxID=1386089 RepID=W9GAU1_9MICO|nr:sigma-70 family RNA polymerase sigma factor [Intrasporangium oryzae]EWT03316.1 RNA polymerase sigma 70 [Intrasporangium oryzae NRRL B-24470]